MPPTPKHPPAQTQRFQEKRESILHAAATQFNQHGVKGATLADIASSVGLVTNSVTYYYRKKEDLATACFMRSIEVFRRTIDLAAQHKGSEARVQAFFRQHAQLLATIDRGEHPPVMQFNDMRALPAPQFAVVSQAYTDMFRSLREMLRSESLERADLSARAYMVISVAHWMRGWVDRFETTQYEHIADQVSDILLRGIGQPGAAWSPPSETEHHWQLNPQADAAIEPFLRAASMLVNEHGYRGASVDMISAQLNVTKGSFYHHNDHKEDLILACFDRTFAVIRRAQELAQSVQGSGWDRSRAIASALARFQLSPQGPLLRQAAITALSDPVRRADVRRTMAQLSERLGTVVVEGMMDGSIRPMHPVIAAVVASGLVNSAASLPHWVPGASESTVDALFVRPIFLGILCPATPA